MRSLSLTILLLSLCLSGCAGSSAYMRDVPDGERVFAPETDKALVVFMRPSGLGFAVQSSVFDITSGEPDFVGIVSAKTKVAHSVNPGQRRFMVIGESADFMDATLQEGKAYYAVVTPRFGVWKARFSLRPVHRGELGSDEFQEWYDSCRWVENTPDAHQWAQQNLQDVKSKQEGYLPDWIGKSDKPILMVEDGRDAPGVDAGQPDAPQAVAAVANPPSGGAEPTAAGRSESEEAESVLWESIKNSRNPRDFQAYLDAYPEGLFSSLARSRADAPADALWSPAFAREVPESERRRVMAYFKGNEHTAKRTLTRYNERHRIASSPSRYSFKVVEILAVDVLDADRDGAIVKVTFTLDDFWRTPDTYIYKVSWLPNGLELAGHQKPQ